MAEIQCMIEDLSWVVQELQRREHVDAHMEILGGRHTSTNILESSPDGDDYEVEEENPFPDPSHRDFADGGALENQLAWNLDQ